MIRYLVVFLAGGGYASLWWALAMFNFESKDAHDAILAVTIITSLMVVGGVAIMCWWDYENQSTKK